MHIYLDIEREMFVYTQKISGKMQTKLLTVTFSGNWYWDRKGLDKAFILKFIHSFIQQTLIELLLCGSTVLGPWNMDEASAPNVEREPDNKQLHKYTAQFQTQFPHKFYAEKIT